MNDVEYLFSSPYVSVLLYRYTTKILNKTLREKAR